MKITLIVIAIIAVFFVVFQIYTSMATKKSETQAYKVIKVEKEFEIRYYPSTTMAVITSSAKTYKDLGSYGFTKLAAYIFGGNNENKKIAMTSPVHMEIGDTNASMSFVMPANFNKDNLPKPNDSDLSIQTTLDEYVAVITFGGFASNEKIKKKMDELESALIAKNIPYFGHFRYLGYNPPFQLFGRKNEIIVTVKKNEFIQN